MITNFKLLTVAAVSLLLAAVPVGAESRDGDTRENKLENEQKAQEYPVDNTGVNVRDRNDARVTAQDQGSSKSDTRITADIRSSLMKDDSLSVDAHNVKIVTRDGKVTLRGPVKTADERSRVAAIASRAAGGANIENQLEIAVR